VALSYKIVPCKGSRERLGLNHNLDSTAKKVAMVWARDNDWVKKCMEYKVEGARPTRRPNLERLQKDCQGRKLNWENAMVHNRCRKQIRDD